MSADYSKDYFAYKVSRLIALTLCFIGVCAFATIAVSYYVDRNAPKTDNEYTVQLKYLELGYVQRTCGKCTTPTWLKADVSVHCPIDNMECK